MSLRSAHTLQDLNIIDYEIPVRVPCRFGILEAEQIVDTAHIISKGI